MHQQYIERVVDLTEAEANRIFTASQSKKHEKPYCTDLQRPSPESPVRLR